jgi:predicted transcriptional regulator
MQQVVDALQAERDEVKKHLDWLDEQITNFRSRLGDASATTSRARRRQTSRRASARRATTRSRQGDTKAQVIEYLRKHDGATAGDVAKGLNMNRNSVATRLTQMVKAGEIKKAARGYSAKS